MYFLYLDENLEVDGVNVKNSKRYDDNFIKLWKYWKYFMRILDKNGKNKIYNYKCFRDLKREFNR